MRSQRPRLGTAYRDMLSPRRAPVANPGNRSQTRLGSPHPIRTHEPGGEPMRRLSISARGQLPRLFPEIPDADLDVWPTLPDRTRRAALMLLAELIARAADPPTAGAANREHAGDRHTRPTGRP